MVADVSSAINPKASSLNQRNNPKRPPLLPSETDNAIAPRRPKSREVTSRYLSTSSSSATPNPYAQRRASPSVSRTAPSTPAALSTVKRSQSVERSRPATPRPNTPDLRIRTAGELSNAHKMLLTSTRSLSVSFQGSSFAMQVSKAKPAPSPSPISSVRKGTPERRKLTSALTTPARRADMPDNSRHTEQQRWPARSREGNLISKSVDCTDERRSGTNVVRTLQNLMLDVGASFDARLRSNPPNALQNKVPELIVEANPKTGSDGPCDTAVSDAESVSSSSTSGTHDSNNYTRNAECGSRGMVVPARFLLEDSIRLRHRHEPGSPKCNYTAVASQPKPFLPRKISVDSPVSSPKEVGHSRGQSSPTRAGTIRHPSPGKIGTSAPSPSRGMSPLRARSALSGIMNGFVSNTSSILGFTTDARKEKIGENRIVDAHMLRILHNRLLQWLFMNARADASLSAQRLNAEKSLYNALVATRKLRESVRAKRNDLLLMRQRDKLFSILYEQMKYLEEWEIIEEDYCSSLSGAIEALKASTLRLPVIGGARTDVQNVKDSISSAVDVMQAMASSICLLLPKVEDVNAMVGELAKTVAKESALLGQCKDLLSMIVAMQVKECSLRTHILQQNSRPSSLTDIKSVKII